MRGTPLGGITHPFRGISPAVLRHFPHCVHADLRKDVRDSPAAGQSLPERADSVHAQKASPSQTTLMSKAFELHTPITRRKFIGTLGALSVPALLSAQQTSSEFHLLAMGDWGAPPHLKDPKDVITLRGY